MGDPSWDDNFDAKISSPEIKQLVSGKIEELRKKLLDATRRNPLINLKFRPNSTSMLRVVDELPDVLRFNLSSQNEMRLVSLPALEDDLPDEQTNEFLDALFLGRQEDIEYKDAINKLDVEKDGSEEVLYKLERELKDRIREYLRLDPRPNKDETSLNKHAKLHNISPSYELPSPEDENEDGRHNDNDIQTLLLPEKLSRTVRLIAEKGKSFERETGVNVLQVAFGLLEWKDPQEREKYVSPLLMMEISIERRQSRAGAEFYINGIEKVSVNQSILQKLQTEHRLELPEYSEGGIEEYFKIIQAAHPSGWHWKVKREVCFGIFPSSKIAMYHDINPAKEEISDNKILAQLLATTGSGDSSYAETYDTDKPEVAETVPYLIADADASQFSALVDVANNKNISIEGPPGSGKSQTIVNLISAALKNGKKVLFVAEKLTALDVVKSRLEAYGLGNFILPLQAKRNASNDIYDGIEQRLEMESQYSDLKRDYSYKQKALIKSRNTLQEYLDVLGEYCGSTGLTNYEVIGKAISTHDIREPLPKNIRRLKIENVDSLNRDEVQLLLSEVQQFAASIDRLNSIPKLWMQSKKPIFNLDDAEDICETSAQVVKELEEVQSDSALADMGILLQNEIFETNLDPAIELINEVSRSFSSIDSGLLNVLLDRTTRYDTDCACDLLDERDELIESQIVSLVGKQAQVNWNAIEKAADFAKKHDGFISPEAHDQKARLYQDQLNELKKLIAAAEVLPEDLLNTRMTLSKIHDVALEISNIDNEILQLRRTGLAKSVAETSVTLKSKLRLLQKQLLKIQHDLPKFNGKLSFVLVKLHYEVIANANFMKKMSRGFKDSVSFYKGLSGGREPSQVQMASNLSLVYNYARDVKDFQDDNFLKADYGSKFQGIDTDLSEIQKIADFCSLYSDLAGYNPVLLRYLEDGDLTSLIGFAKTEQRLPEETFETVKVRSIELGEKFTNENSISENAKSHLKLFENRTVVSVAAIENCTEANERASALLVEVAQSSFGPKLKIDFRNIEYKTEFLRLHCGIAEKIENCADPIKVIASIQDRTILDMVETANKLKLRLENLDRDTQFISDSLGLTRGYNSLRDFAAKTSELLEASTEPNALLERTHLIRIEELLREKGMASLIDWVLDNAQDFDQQKLHLIAESLIAKSMADIVYKKNEGALLHYDGKAFDNIRAEIQEKDKQLITLSRQIISDHLIDNASPPAGNNVGSKKSFTDMSLLRHELHKKKRRVGVRDLTKRAGKALQELNPCWMMSPLAVAQYLHKDLFFDLLVIDEASQLTPENAIGAISRANQVVVVGDTKQLPPTNFFSKILDDTDVDEDLREDSESILDLANIAFTPIRQLRWHYRSRHSSLIQFSNKWMYKGELTIFPSANESDPDLGIELVEIPGTYKARRNIHEAQEIVKRTIFEMEENPSRSIGICTMNTDQKELISEEFERERAKNSKVRHFIEKWEHERFGLEEFFIKNLETIQGDERDVMMISTLYGPEEVGGKVLQRFGPINSANGHRRLNVLFSRAKEKIITFTSMKSNDILFNENQNKGVQMFKAWLEYSKTGYVPDTTSPNGDTESPFEDYVAAQLERLGCEVTPQVGASGFRIDLGIKHPDWPYGYLLGVECDGATYHSSKSSRDRDRLRQEVLEGLGWKIHRIWSTDWFRNPKNEIEILKEVIQSTIDENKRLGGQPKNSPPINDEDDLNDEDVLDWPQSLEQKPTPEIRKDPDIKMKEPAERLIQIGSVVRVKQISEGGGVLEITLIHGENDPDNGMVGVHAPLGSALLGAAADEIIEYKVGAYIKEVQILSIEK